VLQVQAYRPDQAHAWNALNQQARNGHFLFDRGFMDYHADRFEDSSLMVLEDGVPIALLPANRAGDQVWTHQGLTFGGLISGALGASRVQAVLDTCAAHLAAQGVKSLVYKAQPWIYHRSAAQEDLYWLFRRNAVLIRRDLSTAIDYRARESVSSRRRRGARKAQSAGLVFGRSEDWPRFWEILETVLGNRHGAMPVHTLAEIELLAARFPDAIALHTATQGSVVMAGVVMFCSPQVAHAQYIAANEAGRSLAALDGLFEHLIAEHSRTHRYFDFGISTTDQGRVLNEGLVRQKEEFGGGGLVHDFYVVPDLR
jgi:hypothetical protein